MSDTVKAALIVLIGLILAGFLSGGIYQVTTLSRGAGDGVVADAYRVNRFTGEVVAILNINSFRVRTPAETAEFRSKKSN
jgi:hypothetical protein